MPWIRFRLIDRPYYDPRTGEILASIDGLTNSGNGNLFQGGGEIYPQAALGLKCLNWQERGSTLLLLIDEPQDKIDQVMILSGPVTFDASPTVTLTYDLADFAPMQLTNEEALRVLKTEIGLPDGTVLDAHGIPIVP